MSNSTVKLLIVAVLLLHGLGHLGALGGILWHNAKNTTGDWLSDRSWLLPALTPSTAKTVASLFWVVSVIGFIATVMAFWGLLIPTGLWRPLAIASSIVSGTGIIIFIGTWPAFNTLAALGVNVAVLVTQLWTHWPPPDMFGN